MNRFDGRVESIAGILARAARDGLDVADLIASAIRSAAARLDGTVPPDWDSHASGLDALLAGRSGSWEAEYVSELAGGWEYETKVASS